MTALAAKFRFQEFRLICVIAIGLVWLVTDSAIAQPPAPAKPVTVAQTISDTVKSGQTFVGSVTPIRKVVIGSAVDGRVVNFYVDAGVRVKAQEPLAQLLTATIELELQTAESELELRIAELKELDPSQRIEIGAESHSESGSPSPERVVSASAEPTEKKVGKLDKEIVEADALSRAANASQDNAKAEYLRAVDLWKKKILTQQNLDAAKLEVDLAGAVVEERTAALKYAKSTKQFRINQAKARVNMQAAIVEKLKDQITKHTIIARFDGFVTQEFTEEGAWVNRGDPVAEVVALDEVDVLANVLESQVSYIHKGDPIRVEIPALPDRVFTGYIEAIVPQADPLARTFPVKIRLQNEVSGDEPTIKAGMLARAMLPTGPLTKGLFVPKDAINLGGRTPLVYVVQQKNATDDTGTATPVPVRLGIAYGSLIEVQGELKDGDLVVVRGNERLRPTDTVKITARIDSNDLKETAPVSTKAAPETPQAAETEPASTEESR